MNIALVLLRVSVVFLLVITLGCAVNEGPTIAPRFDEEATNIHYDDVALLDDVLAHKIEVQQSGIRPTATDNVEAYMMLRNRTDFSLQIECRAQFFDQAGIKIEGPTAWKRVILDPNAIVTWSEFSTKSGVAHFYIEVREGR